MAVEKDEILDNLGLWIGFTPEQAMSLDVHNYADPGWDGRFGMRKCEMAALERAVIFNPDCDPKQLVAFKVTLTATGVTTLIDQGILCSQGEGWYRWYGRLFKEQENLYSVDTVHAAGYM